MPDDRDTIDATRYVGAEAPTGLSHIARPVIMSAAEDGAVLRTAIKSTSLVVSLGLHAGAAAAMLVWFDPKPGAVADLTEAISVEIITSDVIEAMELAPLTATSTAVSSPDIEAGSAHEAPAQQQSDKIEPTTSDPMKELIAKAERAAPGETDPEPKVAEVRPVDAEPSNMPAATEKAVASEQITARLDEALVVVVPGGEDAPAPSSNPSPQKESRETDASAAGKPKHAAPVLREPKHKVAPRKTVASMPSRKGGDPSRGAQASKATAARASASTGAAINYAAIVRARVASRRPSGQGQRGTVHVTFGVSPSGGLTFASVSRSSGDPGLDRSVLAAVRSAAPFPPPPTGASLKQRQFSMPFDFR